MTCRAVRSRPARSVQRTIRIQNAPWLSPPALECCPREGHIPSSTQARADKRKSVTSAHTGQLDTTNVVAATYARAIAAGARIRGVNRYLTPTRVRRRSGRDALRGRDSAGDELPTWMLQPRGHGVLDRLRRGSLSGI